MSQMPGGPSPYGPSPFGGGFGGGMRNPAPYGGGIGGGLMNKPSMNQYQMPPMNQMPRRMPGGPSKGGASSTGGWMRNLPSSPMMQRPMPGGPGKARNRGQSGGGSWFGGGMPGGPGKGRSQDPFRRQTMQPQPDQMVGNNPVSTPTGGQDTSTDYSGYLDFYNNRNFQLKPVGNNPPQVDLSQHQRPAGIPGAPTGGQLMRQMQEGQIGRPQPMPFQGGQRGIVAGEMGGNQRMQGLGSPQFSVGGGYGQAPMMNPMAQQAQQGFFGQLQSMPYRPSFGQARTQGPMNMPQPIMRTGRRFYGGGIMDLYPR